MMNNVTEITLPASRETLANLQLGDEVRLFGTIYTMRDAGHVRTLEYLHQYGQLPYDLAGQALFYAGPTQPVGDRPFGAIGPTTASRMDFATPELLQAGINLTLGKGPRSAEVAEACALTGSVYLTAIGGAAAYLASFVQKSELIDWEDLGPEALLCLTLNGLPAFVAIDANGNTHGNTPNKPFSGETQFSVDPALTPSSAKNDGFEPFITFEGGDGVGKSTQIKLLKARLEAAGYQVLCLREPGGTVVGEQIRSILLNPDNTSMQALSELLLYEAARAQLVKELIRPALALGKVVLCDRFSDSTFAYQAIARGLNPDLVNRANIIGSDGLIPVRTILIEQDVSHGLKKATEAGADRLEAEGLDFHQKVHAGFAQLAAAEPMRIRRVPSLEQKQDTAAAIFEQLKDLFPKAAKIDFEITADLLQKIKDSK